MTQNNGGEIVRPGYVIYLAEPKTKTIEGRAIETSQRGNAGDTERDVDKECAETNRR